MKSVLSYSIFILLDILIFFIADNSNENSWSFKLFFTIWVAALFFVIFLLDFFLKRVVLIPVWRVATVILLSYPILVMLLAGLVAEPGSLIYKIRYLFEYVDLFKYITIPYIVSFVITIVLQLVYRKGIY